MRIQEHTEHTDVLGCSSRCGDDKANDAFVVVVVVKLASHQLDDNQNANAITGAIVPVAIAVHVFSYLK